MPEEEIVDEDMAKHKESLLTKYLRVVGVVLLYWTVSISMVFVNKYLLKVGFIFARLITMCPLGR